MEGEYESHESQSDASRSPKSNASWADMEDDQFFEFKLPILVPPTIGPPTIGPAPSNTQSSSRTCPMKYDNFNDKNFMIKLTHIPCKICGDLFSLTPKEAHWFNSRNLEAPKRCKSCRSKAKIF